MALLVLRTGRIPHNARWSISLGVLGRHWPACRESTIPLAANHQKQKGHRPATPWARMLSSPAVWAIVINNFTFHYAFYVVMNWLPTYFDRVSTARRALRSSWPGQPLLVPDLLP